MRVPLRADPEVQAAFREVWEAIDSLRGRELDLRSARVRGARQAQSKRGLVTLEQMENALSGLDKKLRKDLG